MRIPNYDDAERELRKIEGKERGAMQDRTRAIAEAAEALACEVALASAMALPAAVGGGRLRREAIVRAAFVADLEASPVAPRIRAVLMPEPKLTRTRPRGPGRYFYKLEERHCVGDREPCTDREVALVTRDEFGNVWYEGHDGGAVAPTE